MGESKNEGWLTCKNLLKTAEVYFVRCKDWFSIVGNIVLCWEGACRLPADLLLAWGGRSGNGIRYARFRDVTIVTNDKTF